MANFEMKDYPTRGEAENSEPQSDFVTNQQTKQETERNITNKMQPDADRSFGMRTLLKIGRTLGVADQRNLLLWEEAFVNRAKSHDVGLCIRNACVCLICCGSRIAGEHNGKARPEDFHRGEDAKLAYDNFIRMEAETPRDALGVPLTAIRPDFILALAKDVFNKFTAKGREAEWTNRKISKRLQPLPTHFPWFLTIFSIIQVIACIVLCCLGGLERIGLDPVVETIPDVLTFRGSESVDLWIRPNVWIGPPLATFISAGAVYSPCMRKDETIKEFLESLNYRTNQSLGCCTVEKHGTAATTTEDECKPATLGGGTWINRPCSSALVKVKHLLRPCCFGLLGNCKMTTRTGCEAQDGYYFSSGPSHCSQVFCFPHFCGNVGLEPSNEDKFMPDYVNQGWRFLSAIFYSPGILHLLFILFVQWVLVRPIECMVGSFRMAITYFYAAFGGLLMGGFMEPYLPSLGSGGGISCVLAISFIEVFQAKNIIHFWKELLLLIFLALVIIVVGFLPLVSNFVHLGGIIFGLPMAFLLMPHLNINMWTITARRWIVVTSIVVIILILMLFLLLFYLIQDTGACSGCYYFSCIPFTEHMCNVLVELIGTLNVD